MHLVIFYQGLHCALFYNLLTIFVENLKTCKYFFSILLAFHNFFYYNYLWLGFNIFKLVISKSCESVQAVSALALCVRGLDVVVYLIMLKEASLATDASALHLKSAASHGNNSKKVVQSSLTPARNLIEQYHWLKSSAR